MLRLLKKGVLVAWYMYLNVLEVQPSMKYTAGLDINFLLKNKNFNRELVSTVLRVYMLLGISRGQQVFALYILL